MDEEVIGSVEVDDRGRIVIDRKRVAYGSVVSQTFEEVLDVLCKLAWGEERGGEARALRNVLVRSDLMAAMYRADAGRVLRRECAYAYDLHLEHGQAWTRLSVWVTRRNNVRASLPSSPVPFDHAKKRRLH